MKTQPNASSLTIPESPADILRAIGLDGVAAISVNRFSSALSRKRGWGYAQIRAGKVKTLDIGGNLLIPVTEVLRYLAK